MSTAEIQFSEERHEYTVSGIKYPSVTTVLAGVGLIDTSWFDEKSAQRGRVVHRVTELEDNGTLNQYQFDPRVLGWLEAWRAFKKDVGFDPSQIERRVFNPIDRYCGTLDRIGTMRGGGIAIVDIKSGVPSKCTGLQLAAYLNCLEMPRGYRRFAVQISDDGKFHVTEYKVADYRRDREGFLSALNVYRLKEEYGCLPKQ